MTQAFNLSQFANNVNSSGKADLTTAVTGTLPVGNGGTGSTGLTQYGVVIGGGSSALGTVSTTSPTTAAAGDLLVYQGSGLSPAWKTPVVGTTIEYITTTTLWTVPAGVTKALVWVFGGAGGGSTSGVINGAGGYGGYIAGYVTGLSGTVSISVGAGGSAGSTPTAGGTSSFGSYISATGGAGGNRSDSPPVANGSGSLGAGVTRIRALCGLEHIFSIGTSNIQATYWTSNKLNYSGTTSTYFTYFPQSGLTSGAGNTIWSTNYLEAPGTPFISQNGLGGAVILQY